MATLCAFALGLLLHLVSCSPSDASYGQFKQLPAQGWASNTPLYFTPQYGDSTCTYEVKLSIRHDNSYPYRNLQLVVDLIAPDKTVKRQRVNMEVADCYGNWTGSGFGAVYQCSVVLEKEILPKDLRQIVVWQVMDSKQAIVHISDVGIIVKPRERLFMESVERQNDSTNQAGAGHEAPMPAN